MRRDVDFEIIDKKMGIWKIVCKVCPLKEALKTLNQPERSCVTGLITNCQGPVPVGRCEFFGGDNTLKTENKIMSLECNK